MLQVLFCRVSDRVRRKKQYVCKPFFNIYIYLFLYVLYFFFKNIVKSKEQKH